mgnify:CR=1 FL=1
MNDARESSDILGPQCKSQPKIADNNSVLVKDEPVLV